MSNESLNHSKAGLNDTTSAAATPSPTPPSATSQGQGRPLTVTELPRKRMAGRPSTYTRIVADEICLLIASGKSLNSSCESKEHYPTSTTFRSWVIDDVDGISSRSARAYSIGHDAIADDCIKIADTEPDPQRARVRVDTRLRLLGKWAPKKYGERVAMTGADGEGAIQIVVNRGLDPAGAAGAAATAKLVSAVTEAGARASARVREIYGGEREQENENHLEA